MLSMPSLFKWFSNNYIKVISNKSHLVMSVGQKVNAEVHNHELEFQNIKDLLGIDIDSTLISEYHISKICKKAIQKLIVKKLIVKKKSFGSQKF